ncbi:hypothetical protein KDJ56_05555 [Brevibacillus composti]|uniref:PLP-dependent aminotransferase family protein n=1 Tax=Brevibacillus composti TaxID=2796470 RepID=A0A7T5JPU6_9BACL|nr:hypothetical protein [Brevibacillus composti]QQE75436.1 hypothetical protein JD108_05875 [Brevibacillus composti]QUO42462.1 hypothetical protein KDJ56_05555 [Brevibacillus composti]
MRTIYQRKHRLLVEAIRAHMPVEVSILGHSVGLHILLEVRTPLAETELVEAAARADVRVFPTSRSWVSTRQTAFPRIIVGFGGVREEDIAEGIKRLAKAWFPAFA